MKNRSLSVLLSVLLCLVLCFSFCRPGYAEGEGNPDLVQEEEIIETTHYRYH